MPKKLPPSSPVYGKPVLLEFDSGWLIEYKFINPENGELIRHRERFQRTRKKIGDDGRARIAAKKRIAELEELLSGGWTPYGSVKLPQDQKLKELVEIYADIKERELRPESMRSLRSYNRLFLSWLKKEHLDHLSVMEFSAIEAQRYLDYVLLKKKVSNMTYNNYLANMKVMWNWFINERNLDIVNPFIRKKKKPVETKIRKIIPKEADERIIGWCMKNDPVLELVCHLIYSSFMRVSEILRTKVSDVHLKDGYILLPGSITKNKKARVAYLNKESIRLMIDNGIGNACMCDQLIGKLPGVTGKLVIGWNGRTIKTNDLDRSWERLRVGLHLPKEYKLYSFRDTGITDLATMGLPDDLIVKITGHMDKGMVNVYKSPNADQNIIQLLHNVSQTLGERRKLTDEEIVSQILHK